MGSHTYREGLLWAAWGGATFTGYESIQIGIISDFRGHALETSGGGLQTDSTLVFY